MEQGIQEVGLKIFNTEQEFSDGLMIAVMKDSIERAKSMAMVNILGKIVVVTRGNGYIIKWKDSDIFIGMMDEVIKDNGKIIR